VARDDQIARAPDVAGAIAQAAGDPILEPRLWQDALRAAIAVQSFPRTDGFDGIVPRSAHQVPAAARRRPRRARRPPPGKAGRAGSRRPPIGRCCQRERLLSRLRLPCAVQLHSRIRRSFLSARRPPSTRARPRPRLSGAPFGKSSPAIHAAASYRVAALRGPCEAIRSPTRYFACMRHRPK
jgi:hypothetical protein